LTVQLFVKSQFTAGISRRGRGALAPEDAKARADLRREGIEFETIDLSKAIRERLQARFGEIKVTPTLLDEHSPGKMYVGTQAITEYIEETRAAARRSPTHWTTRSRWV
jgi:hypothetical protein